MSSSTGGLPQRTHLDLVPMHVHDVGDSLTRFLVALIESSLFILQNRSTSHWSVYRLLVIALATESLALVTVLVVIILMAPRPLRTLRSLSSRHVGARLSETADGCVRVELDLLTEAVLLLLPALHLEPLVSPSSSSAVVLLPELVTDLATTSATAELASLLVSRVEVAADDALVQLRAGDVAQTRDSLGVKVVLHEGKTTRRPGTSASYRHLPSSVYSLLVSVETHDDSSSSAVSGSMQHTS